jgi:hypothetical protein
MTLFCFLPTIDINYLLIHAHIVQIISHVAIASWTLLNGVSLTSRLGRIARAVI